MELWSAEYICVKGRYESDWGVLVDEKGIIQAVGPRSQLVARARAVYHYSGRLLLPSFANPHHHGFHRAFRGVSDFDISFPELVNRLIWPVSQAIDLNLFTTIHKVALAEQMLCGIGALGEFHYLHNGQFEEAGQANFGEALIKIAIELGMRLTLVFAFFDQGGSSSKAFIQPLDVSLEEFNRLQKKYGGHPLINIIPGIHSLEHTSPEAIMAAGELAREHKTRLHVQLAERESELESAQVQYGTTPLRALEKIGVLDQNLVIINGTLLDDEELSMVREYGASMVLCPGASLARGDDFPNTWGALREGISFAVGSDSLAMNHLFQLPDEIKWLEYSLRSLQKSMNVLASNLEIDSLWDLASEIPGRLLTERSAQLMPGNTADFMIVDLNQRDARPSLNLPGHHYTNQLLFGWGAQARVTHLVVQGRQVVRNGHHTADLRNEYRQLERWNEAFLRSIKKTDRPRPNYEDTQINN